MPTPLKPRRPIAGWRFAKGSSAANPPCASADVNNVLSEDGDHGRRIRSGPCSTPTWPTRPAPHCHELMDPIGHGLEHYDRGRPISRNSVTEPSESTQASSLTSVDVAGSFNGGLELSATLTTPKAPTPARCLSRQIVQLPLQPPCSVGRDAVQRSKAAYAPYAAEELQRSAIWWIAGRAGAIPGSQSWRRGMNKRRNRLKLPTEGTAFGSSVPAELGRSVRSVVEPRALRARRTAFRADS